MRYIKKIGSVVEYSGLNKLPETMTAAGWTAYDGSLPVSRLDVVDGVPVELPEPEPLPVVRYLNKLDLRDRLAALGLWEGIRGFLEAQPDTWGQGTEWERFSLGRGIYENEPEFIVLREQLEPILTENGIDIDALLDECKIEE